MYHFQITIHMRGERVGLGDTHRVESHEVRALEVPREALAEPMGVSFEQAASDLARLPRMFVEPDGNLVWVSASQDKPRWQVDGNLYDRAGRLAFVDLSGTCPPKQFDQLLGCLGWPETRLMFQLTRQALFLDESEFRRFAGR